MKKRTVQVSGNVPVSFYQEGDAVIACCPVLDLVTCGDTFAEAEHNFNDALKVFVEECVSHGTLEKVLLSSGWRRRGRGSSARLEPPLYLGHSDVSLGSALAATA